MTATFTADFRHEFEAERREWLRRRFLWYTGVIGGLSVLNMLGGVATFFFDDELVRSIAVPTLLLNLASVGLYVGAFGYALRRGHLLSRETFVRLVIALIIASGLLQLASTQVSMRIGQEVAARERAEREAATEGELVPDDALAEGAPAEGAPPERPEMVDVAPGVRVTEDTPTGFAVGLGFLASVCFSHILASLFIPWTPRESVIPLIPLLLIYALLVLFFSGSIGFGGRVLAVAVAPVIGVPGVTIAWWRHGRFRQRFHYRMLRGRYGEMKRELVDARRIHEALFPSPLDSGPVRFDYRYEPMRQIGGDFLFAHIFPGIDPSMEGQEPISVVIIDVTGHGIPAALTVNRLHGELERIFAEEPDIGPGEVLRSLNRYVHLTLSRHSVYATAICLRADPTTSTLQWASAGHPPAFLRTVDGRLEEINSTTFVLGACHGADFDPDEQSVRFMPGDTLIAYTDGATEARSATGAMLRTEGLRNIVIGSRPDPGPDGGWSSAVLRAVDRHRHGPPADDTLIVELYRPLGDGSAPGRGKAAQARAGSSTASPQRSSIATSAESSS